MTESKKNIIDEINVDWKLSFTLGALIGAAFFIGIFGIKVLDVTYIDWMTYEYDLTQHITGWRMYRSSGWHFPFGLCDTGMYPYYTSVVYTDSIPIVALFFKILSPILPAKFQYFGLYGLFVFMMQGGMAKILIRKYIDKEWLCNVGAVFFITCIAFVQRMFWQTALSSHFLLLIAIALFIYRDDIKEKKNRIILWSALGALSVSIHFYLYGMISVMLAGFALLEFLYELPDVKKGVITFFEYLIPYLFFSVLLFYLFGGFYGTINIGNSNNFIHAAFLDALFDPKEFSLFIHKREYDDGELEGLAYLGVAIMILLIPAFISFIKDIKRLWKEYRFKLIIVLLLVVFFFAFSLSPAVFLNGEYLFSVGFIPQFLQRYSWGLFRACGRFMWPIMYMLILLAIVYSFRLIKKFYPVILVFLMLLQIVEFSGYFKKTFDTFDSIERLPCPADVLNNYDLSSYKHIQLMENYTWYDFYSDLTCYYEFVGYSRLALDHNMTISNFQFARDYDVVVQEQIDSCYQKLTSGSPDSDTLYVFPKAIYESNGLYGQFDNVYEFDTGYDIVLVPR